MQPATTSTGTPAAGETTTPVDDVPNPVPKVPRPPLRLVLACLAALALFVGSVALLYYTWLPRQNPNAMLIVIGNADYEGAEVTVVPRGSASGAITAKIRPDDDYRLRFHVPPGLYSVTIRKAGRQTIVIENAETRGFPPWGIRIRPTGEHASDDARFAR